jgi:predicted O-methyltransferase YrrM
VKHIVDRAKVRPRLLRAAPDLRPAGLERLATMYSEPLLHGTEAVEPVEVQPQVRITIEEGAALYDLLRAHNVGSSLEIGFAYGFSTIWFLEALAAQQRARHVAIDPFEMRNWHGVGLKQVELLNSPVAFEFMPERSIMALPELVRREQTFDFVFIDSSHRFDDTMVEYHLCDKLLPVGGLMAFDDIWMPAVKSVVNYILANHDYAPVRQKLNKVAFLRKTGENRRAWDYFRPFSTRDRQLASLARSIRRKLTSGK